MASIVPYQSLSHCRLLTLRLIDANSVTGTWFARVILSRFHHIRILFLLRISLCTAINHLHTWQARGSCSSEIGGDAIPASGIDVAPYRKHITKWYNLTRLRAKNNHDDIFFSYKNLIQFFLGKTKNNFISDEEINNIFIVDILLIENWTLQQLT